MCIEKVQVLYGGKDQYYTLKGRSRIYSLECTNTYQILSTIVQYAFFEARHDIRLKPNDAR